MRSDNMPRPFAPEHSERDIVDALRAAAFAANRPFPVVLPSWSIASDAADEIERLREELDELRNEVIIRIGIDVELQALRAKIDGAPVTMCLGELGLRGKHRLVACDD